MRLSIYLVWLDDLMVWASSSNYEFNSQKKAKITEFIPFG